MNIQPFVLNTLLPLSANIVLLLAWLTGSFLFWRNLRAWAIEEDRIFDLTFYATLVTLLSARVFYVLTHYQAFAGKSVLLVVALWIAPGLSWTGGLVGLLATLVTLSRGYRVRLGLVLDALASTLPLPLLLGVLSQVIRGQWFGSPTTAFIRSMPFIKPPLSRHPAALYDAIFYLFLAGASAVLSKVAARRKLPYGIFGVWFFMLYSVGAFSLEFFKESTVYFRGLTANQWILIGIFAESIGVMYVRGGGREALRPAARSFRAFFVQKGKKLYESISRRHTDRA